MRRRALGVSRRRLRLWILARGWRAPVSRHAETAGVAQDEAMSRSRRRGIGLRYLMSKDARCRGNRVRSLRWLKVAAWDPACPGSALVSRGDCARLCCPPRLALSPFACQLRRVGWERSASVGSTYGRTIGAPDRVAGAKNLGDIGSSSCRVCLAHGPDAPLARSGSGSERQCEGQPSPGIHLPISPRFPRRRARLIGRTWQRSSRTDGDHPRRALYSDGLLHDRVAQGAARERSRERARDPDRRRARDGARGGAEIPAMLVRALAVMTCARP